jgi:hypothetical protein
MFSAHQNSASHSQKDTEVDLPSWYTSSTNSLLYISLYPMPVIPVGKTLLYIWLQGRDFLSKQIVR